jgi:NAD+ synthase
MVPNQLLSIDCAAEAGRITAGIREALKDKLKRRGLIVAISGGIDSSVSLALAAAAVGPDRVLALQLPEKQSSADTLRLSALAADAFGIPRQFHDISGILDAVDYYGRYMRAMRRIFPDYDGQWLSKIVISNALEHKGFSVFSAVAQSPAGQVVQKRLDAPTYLEIVACTNFKQRIRKMLEYYHADRLNYAVVGTPNRLEYDQGFFVKLGDGAADIKPIAHLYKTQVYALANYLKVPKEIVDRVPTTDTYSLPQGQDEFFFSLPYDKMDICLFGKNNNFEPRSIGEMIALSEDQVKRVYQDIEQKRSTTRYLHLAPVLIEKIAEVAPENG